LHFRKFEQPRKAPKHDEASRTTRYNDNQHSYPKQVHIQTTYPMPNNANKQNKTETNPPPPHSLQIREPLQQIDNFPTDGRILTITEGSNTDFDNKRQLRDYSRQVNHVTIEGPVTKANWSHIPITFST
jgi:hypothetical protein